LPSRAADRTTPYGIAVELEPFRNDPLYRQALIEHADILVPMNMLKWASLRHTKGKFDFERADEIISFAREHGKSVRGHTLVWYGYNPKWVEDISSAREAERVLVDHIEQVVGHYRGVVPSWDVVNEVVAHDPLSEGAWRRGIWQDLLGPKHVEIAFQAAARTDPAAKLVINDYDLENAGRRFDARRAAILNIVRNLQDKNIPVHGVGLQAHLYAERRIDRQGLGAFIQALERLGVKILITELDVIDWRLSKNPVKRDIGVANVVAEFLEVVYAVGRPGSITTWGISDRYSWVSDVFKRKDGAPNRPLPMDTNYQPKLFMDVLEKYRIL
jgi:endo-1,4-beta-xylanase